MTIRSRWHGKALKSRFGREMCRAASARRGAAMIETAISILVFLALVMGMLDLGLAVFRRHVLAEAARHLARRAIVHGELADRLGPWGPTTFSGTAAASHPVADTVRGFLNGGGSGTPILEPTEVTVSIEWPGGSNEVEQPVRVTLGTTHQLFTTSLIPFVDPTIDLVAMSEMTIAH